MTRRIPANLWRIVSALRSRLVGWFSGERQSEQGEGAKEQPPYPSGGNGAGPHKDDSEVRQLLATRRQVRETRARVQYLTDLREVRMRKAEK